MNKSLGVTFYGPLCISKQKIILPVVNKNTEKYKDGQAIKTVIHNNQDWIAIRITLAVQHPIATSLSDHWLKLTGLHHLLSISARLGLKHFCKCFILHVTLKHLQKCFRKCAGLVVHSDSPKRISIRFNSCQTIDSNRLHRFDSTRERT